MDKVIAIIGPYPTPYGGISVHIQRTINELERRNIRFDFIKTSGDLSPYKETLNFRTVRGALRILNKLFFNKYKLIHLHSPNFFLRIIISSLALFGKNIFIHVHGSSLKDSLAGGFLKRKIIQFFLSKTSIIADNKEIYKLALSLAPKKVFLIDAFIPPLISHKEIENLSGMIKKETADLILSMNGWFQLYSGKDLYGFDILCEALNILKNKIKIKVLVSINGVGNKAVEEDFYLRVKSLNLMNNFIFMKENLKEFWPIQFYSDLFIRPTISDGNALSIEEALWLGTSVLTSDCVPRPAGCIIFKCSSAVDFAVKIQEFYNNKVNKISLSQKFKIASKRKFSNKLIDQIYAA